MNPKRNKITQQEKGGRRLQQIQGVTYLVVKQAELARGWKVLYALVELLLS